MTATGTEDEPATPGGEDALLLREFAHRTGNALAVAEAALRLGASGRGGGGGAMVERARARIEGLGAVHRLLARPVDDEEDLAGQLGKLCVSLHGAAVGGGGGLVLDLCEARVDGALARRLLLVAAELVTNAHRHAFDEDGDGALAIALRRRTGTIELVVSDRAGGRAEARPGGTGFGRGIVEELVARSGGSIVVERRRAGTEVRVSVPDGREAFGAV